MQQLVLVSLALVLPSLASAASAQTLPPGYEQPPPSRSDMEPDPAATDAPPLPPSYLETEGPEQAPPHESPELARLRQQEASIRASFARLSAEGRRYRWGWPMAVAAAGLLSFSYSLQFLRSEKDSFFPDPRDLRISRGLTGASTILFLGGLAWFIWAVVRRREWKRRFIPVRDMVHQLERARPSSVRVAW